MSSIKVKFKLNREGVRQLLLCDEMLEITKKYGFRAQEQCGEGYVLEERTYPERKGVAIVASTYHAKADNSKNNTLLKALGGSK